MDILRAWVNSSDYSGDIPLSDLILGMPFPPSSPLKVVIPHFPRSFTLPSSLVVLMQARSRRASGKFAILLASCWEICTNLIATPISGFFCQEKCEWCVSGVPSTLPESIFSVSCVHLSTYHVVVQVSAHGLCLSVCHGGWTRVYMNRP